MPPKQKDLMSYLEKKRAIKTLLCLLNGTDKGLDSLLESIGGSKTTGMSRIIELVEMNLVEKKSHPNESRKMFYTLTEEGKQIAEKLREILELINE